MNYLLIALAFVATSPLLLLLLFLLFIKNERSKPILAITWIVDIVANYTMLSWLFGAFPPPSCYTLSKRIDFILINSDKFSARVIMLALKIAEWMHKRAPGHLHNYPLPE